MENGTVRACTLPRHPGEIFGVVILLQYIFRQHVLGDRMNEASLDKKAVNSA